MVAVAMFLSTGTFLYANTYIIRLADVHTARASLAGFYGHAEQGGTHDQISDFSFWGRTDKGHEIVLELASGAAFACVLHHFSGRGRLEGS